MINVKRFNCNMLSENCYVVSDETKECVIIDCGAYYPEEVKAITSYIDAQGLKPVKQICTHGHFDHCMGCGAIYNHYGLKPEVHSDDDFLMEKLPQQIEEMIGVRVDIDVAPVGRYLNDDDTISFGSHTLSLLHTPGHTPGGVVFYCAAEGIAFSGDTLFRMSIGRTDFERGSFEQMKQSLSNMAQLPKDTIVYPGHGPQTTIGEELQYNPYMTE